MEEFNQTIVALFDTLIGATVNYQDQEIFAAFNDSPPFTSAPTAITDTFHPSDDLSNTSPLFTSARSALADVASRASANLSTACDACAAAAVMNASAGVSATEEAMCVARWSVQNVIVSVCFTLIFCLSVIGNCVVIVTISKQRNMRTVTNLFLLNLAVSDLLVSVICMPVTLLGRLVQCFLFANWACKLILFLQAVAVTASAYTLAVIAFERFFAIVRPLHSRYFQTPSHAFKMIVGVWTSALTVNVGWLLLMEKRVSSRGQPSCSFRPRMTTEDRMYFQAYVSVTTLVMPLTVMVVLYWFVIRSLRTGMYGGRHGRARLCSTVPQASAAESSQPLTSVRRRLQSVMALISKRRRRAFGNRDVSEEIGPLTNGLCTANADETPNRRSETVCSKDGAAERKRAFHPNAPIRLRSTHMEKSFLTKRRVIRMMVTVCIIFTICWLPLNIYFLLLFALGHFFALNVYHANLHAVLVILGYTSSCTNPVTYCFMNKKFRNAFKASFGCGANADATDTAAAVYRYGGGKMGYTPPALPHRANTVHNNGGSKGAGVGRGGAAQTPPGRLMAGTPSTSTTNVAGASVKPSVGGSTLPPLAELSREEMSIGSGATKSAAESSLMNDHKTSTKINDHKTSTVQWTSAVRGGDDSLSDYDDIDSIHGIDDAECRTIHSGDTADKMESTL